QQREPERVHQNVNELNGGQVEPEKQGRDQAKQGSRPQHRKDAEHDPKCQAQGDFFRRDALGEQLQDGAHQPLLQELFHAQRESRWSLVVSQSACERPTTNDCSYSSVTAFTRLRGRSTSRPRLTAT